MIITCIISKVWCCIINSFIVPCIPFVFLSLFLFSPSLIFHLLLTYHQSNPSSFLPLLYLKTAFPTVLPSWLGYLFPSLARVPFLFQVYVPLSSLPIESKPEALSPGIKWPGHEAHHLSPTCTQIKKTWIISTPLYSFRGQFYIVFLQEKKIV
jgi:hypothetical protein